MKFIIYILLLACGIYANAQNKPIKADSVRQKMFEAKQYLTGNLKPYKPEVAFQLYKECALAGNAEAMNAVGMHYRLGLGIDSNMSAAFQWFQQSAVSGYAKAWYNLGISYKYGSGCVQNFNSAYTCFKKSADMQEPLGWYAQGYMLYKGLGCTQDYMGAFQLFNRGAHARRASCMYFMGLCFRNGYGVQANLDSAKYWLNIASKLGYRFATDELASKEPENNNSANAMVEKVKQLQGKIAPSSINKYTKIEQSIKASDIEGIYSGYLLQYDWSGQHVITAHTLNLALTYDGSVMKGMWVEDDTLSLSLEAAVTKKALVFSNTSYSKVDHYSTDKPVQFKFEEAKLQQIMKGDSLYLAGNLNLSSVERNEPEKPFYVVLARVAKGSNDSTWVNFLNSSSSKLTVYPNPFNNVITVEFELKQQCNVYTQILTADGKVVYTNPAEQLPAGTYSLPMQVNIPSGPYIVKLHYGKEVKTAMVIKQ